MMQLFFGDFWSILSSVFLLLTLAYIIWSIILHKKARFWGRKILTLFLLGLFLCIFVVIRDDYAGAVQGTGGRFSFQSMQIQLAHITAAVIGLSAISSIFIRNQKYRKTLFFVLSAGVLLKAAVIEVSRIWIG